jgi:hypothetical protein
MFWHFTVVLVLSRTATVLVFVIANKPDDGALLRPSTAGCPTIKSIHDQDDAAIDYDNEHSCAENEHGA